MINQPINQIVNINPKQNRSLLQALQEPSPLSSSCRHAALASLARLGHSALPSLTSLKGLGARRTAARILLKAAKECHGAA